MCSFKLTHSQYTHPWVIETIGDQIQFLYEQRSSQISRELSYSAFIPGIGYEVHRYFTTGLLPFQEFGEEQPWTDEVDW